MDQSATVNEQKSSNLFNGRLSAKGQNSLLSPPASPRKVRFCNDEENDQKEEEDNGSANQQELSQQYGDEDSDELGTLHKQIEDLSSERCKLEQKLLNASEERDYYKKHFRGEHSTDDNQQQNGTGQASSNSSCKAHDIKYRDK